MVSSSEIVDIPLTRKEFPPFLEWSQSKIGFYPGTVYRRGDWYPSDKPIKWEPHQAAILSWLLTPNARGRFPVGSITWLDIAKTGKTMLGAAVAQYMGSFVDQGIPGEVLICANSKEHAGVRCFYTLKRSLELNPYRDEIVDQISETPGIHFITTGHWARAVPRKASTQAGTNAVYMNFDEIAELKGREAQRFSVEMKPSMTRNVSFQLYQGYPGYYGDDGILTQAMARFFTEEGAPVPEAKKVPGLEEWPLWVIGDEAFYWNHDSKLYPWLTEAALAKEKARLRAMPNEYLRLYEARVVQPEDTFIPASTWYRCTDPDWPGLLADDRNVPLVCGLDLATVHDSCGLVARAYDVQTGKYPLYLAKAWKPQDFADGGVSGYVLQQVEQFILDLHRKQRILAVYYDPSQAVLMSNNLTKAGVNMVAVGQNSERERADTDYKHAIFDEKLRNYRHAGELSDHVLNAICSYTGHGTLRIRKDKSSKIIDLAVADSMCCYGLATREMRSRFESLARPGYEQPYRRVTNPFGEIFGMSRKKRGHG